MPAHEAVIRAVDGVDQIGINLAESVEEIVEKKLTDIAAPSEGDVPAIMAAIDDPLADAYGATRVGAVSSQTFLVIVSAHDFAAELAYIEFLSSLDNAMRATDSDEWLRVKKALDTERPGDRFARAWVTMSSGTQDSKTRFLRSGALDPQRRWVEADGYRLSDRVWLRSRAVRKGIDRTLVKGIRRGDGPVTIARRLRVYLGPDYSPVRYTADGRVISSLRGNPKGGSFTSRTRTLARTEVTNAYRVATSESVLALEIQGAGVQWALSERHPQIDICLGADASIHTSHGIIPIQDVRVGDLVLTHRGRYRPVTRLYQSQAQAEQCVDLRIQGEHSHSRSLTATGNHPILTDEGWIPAGDLHTGSLVRALSSQIDESRRQPFGGVLGKASRDSGGSVTFEDQQKVAEGRCGACEGSLLSHTPHSYPEGLDRTIGEPPSASSSSPSPCSLRPIADSRVRAVPQTSLPASLRAWTIALGGVFRNSGCSLQPADSMRGSSRLPCCTRCSEIASRMWGTFSFRWRARLSSMLESRISCLAVPPMGGGGTPSRMYHTDSSHPASSPRHGMQLSNTDACGSATGALDRSRAGPFVLRTVRIASSCELTPSMRGTMIPVYNFAVAEDNTYVANGIVVHNCDDLARSSSEGFPRGVYTPAEFPTTPHPSCLCSARPWLPSREIVLSQLVDRYGGD